MPDDSLASLVTEAKELLGALTGGDAPRVEDPLALWKGDFGDEYADRCRPSEAEISARVDLWREILLKADLPVAPVVAEIGANQGQNLDALRRVLPIAAQIGVEPNAKARARIRWGQAIEGIATDVPLEDASADLAFTSGVLIHIPPQDLRKACAEIVRVSRRYVVAVEYFRATPAEIVYRGHAGALWVRDFGAYYMDEFGLKPVAAGFSWKRLTGLDDVHWWLLEKVA